MCWWWIHTWGKWKVIERRKVKDQINGVWGDVGMTQVQERVCERCGYTQIDKQTVLL